MISVKALVSAWVFSFRPGHSEDITEAEMNLRAATKQHSGRGRGSRHLKARHRA